jgi:hypothetical protein
MKVFAKLGSMDRAAINCSESEVDRVKERLSILLDGEWELVENFVQSSQAILFEDANWYKGHKEYPIINIIRLWY